MWKLIILNVFFHSYTLYTFEAKLEDYLCYHRYYCLSESIVTKVWGVEFVIYTFYSRVSHFFPKSPRYAVGKNMFCLV